MQDELIEEFMKPEFQEVLHRRWYEAGEDIVSQAKVRQEVCLGIQGPIIEKYGFEASRKGLAKVLQVFHVTRLGLEPEVRKRAVLLEWLVHPGLQAESPMPVGEAAEGKWAMNCVRGPAFVPPPKSEPEVPPPVAAPQPPAPPCQAPDVGGPLAGQGVVGAIGRSKVGREKVVKAQADLIAACRAPAFQDRLLELSAGGSRKPDVAAAEDAVAAVQRPVLRRYGFLPSRKGAAEWEESVAALAHADPEVSANRAVLAWLLEPRPGHRRPSLDPAGAGRSQPARAADEYRIYATEASDEPAVRGVERCRGALACAHQGFYREAYPGVQQQEWLGALGREGIAAFVREGGLVLHAESVATGEVVGYVSCRCSSREDGEAAGAAAPWAAINHIGVLPGHQGRGVGGQLFEGLLGLLRDMLPGAVDDLRINVVELNYRAVEWYRRLGFVVVQLWVRRFSDKSATVPVVFLTMQRRSNAAVTPWERFFGPSLKGERAVVFPESAPAGLLAHAAGQPWPPPGLAPATVAGFDAADGCHGLEDGRVVDLTDAYAHGRVVFERPLHKVLPSARA